MKTVKPTSIKELKKARKMWEQLLDDGRIAMTPKQVAKQFGDDGLKDCFELPYNKNMHLQGPYPKLLNLHSARLPYCRYDEEKGYFSEDFASLDATGETPPAHLHLINDETLEELYLPANAFSGPKYIALENLPNLRKITIAKNIETGEYPLRNKLSSMLDDGGGNGVKWFYCKHLPNLETIEIEGGLLWLRLQNVPKLINMNLAKANKLSYLYIEYAPKLNKLRVDQCIKLAKVNGLGPVQLRQLGVEAAINRIQKSKSKFDGTIYDNMTISDVHYVLDIINRGWAQAAIHDLLGEEYEERSEIFKKIPGFTMWSFKILNPLCLVSTRGTGMTATFEVLDRDFDNKFMFRYHSEGEVSPEHCLEYILYSLVNSELAKKFNTSKKMLKKLTALIQ
ncbi:MAG: hypothetical protein RLZZ573_1039 [Pseudomonadota bacterium]|jgi:hypothetical protein